MSQEYFCIALSSNISLAISLENMGKVLQIETRKICTIPGVANFWYGVVNFKGSLLWVLDSDRYFNLHSDQPSTQQRQLTAVVVKHHFQDNSCQVALITTQLEGITAFEHHQLERLTSTDQSIWHSCCSAVVHQRTKSIYILNSVNLLKQLNQQSAVVKI